MLTSKETLIMVVYYFLKKVFGKSAQVGKLMELDFLDRFSGRFRGATGHLKRYANSCSFSSKPSLIPVPGLRGHFS